MINYNTDPRIILTLDTGGTNMVFGAMQRGEFIVDPLTLPAHADDLDLCMKTMVDGFRAIIDQLDERPAAISFAFPGPADYPNGIIGGQLLNFGVNTMLIGGVVMALLGTVILFLTVNKSDI
jgi:predicted NBD/HSP70 family sugar kinase